MTQKHLSFYSAPQLAKLLGVNNSTVKRWVDKKILPARVTSGGHRRIYKNDILTFLKSKNKVAKYSYILRQMANSPAITEQSEDYYRFLRQAVRLPETSALEKIFITGTDINRLIEDIITPTLRKIGEEWSKGNLDIYAEHRMTFLLRQELQNLERLMPDPKKKSPLAVLACVTDEHHEIPLILCDLVLKNSGYKTIVLGINTPAEEVSKAANELNANLIVLAKIYSKIDGNDYLKRLIKHLKKQVPIITGGSGWNHAQEPNLPVLNIGKITDLKKVLYLTKHKTTLDLRTQKPRT